MRILTRSVVIALCVAALVALAGIGAGCGSGDGGGPQWEEVVSGELTGDEPAKTLLGTYTLGDRLRVGWDLTGPDDPPVMLTLRAVSIGTGTGFGASLSPQDARFSTQDDEAIVLGPFRPGDYRVYFSQRFVSGEGPGYDGTFTISTTK